MTSKDVLLILWGVLAVMTLHFQRINAENCEKSKTLLIHNTSLYCADCALTECVNENYTCQPIGLIFCSPSERHIEKCDTPAFCISCEWKNGSRTGNCLEDVIKEVDRVKRCPDLDLSPGVRTTPGSSFTVGGSARFQCIDTNKVLSGNQVLNCLSNQTWDKSPPTCDIDNPNKCISGSWGNDCMNACGYCHTALSEIKSEYDCDPVTGACSQGCQEGYNGSNCDQAICKQDCGPGLCVGPNYCANCGDISLVSPNCEDIRIRGLLGPLYASVIFSMFLAIGMIGSKWYKRRGTILRTLRGRSNMNNI